MTKESFPPHAIAVVGLAGRFPGARDLDHFWQNIRNGVEIIETLSEADLVAAGVSAASRNDANWVRKVTTLEGALDFDAQFFGISPREAQFIDPQQRVFLECAYEALEHAGWGDRTDGLSVGVYAGAGMNWYLLEHIAANPDAARAVGAYQIMLGNDKDFLCTRASYKLDLRGPSVSIQTACSTSLVAVVTACRALAHGECDMALAGGVAIAFPERTGYRYEVGMILSPDGHCRPFDAAAAGIRPGAGAGVVVLKRLADAVADRDTIHAVIRGGAINNDGAGKAGYTAPSIDGQIEVIATAQALAEVDPRSIAYIEAHGTGTPLGDPIEFTALNTVFRSGTEDVGFCQLGSLKANIGHLDIAAGVAGFIKAIQVLKNREFPPLVNFRSPNPQLELESSPFFDRHQRQRLARMRNAPTGRGQFLRHRWNERTRRVGGGAEDFGTASDHRATPSAVCRRAPRPRSIRQSRALRPICPQPPTLIWRMFPGRSRSAAGTSSIARLWWPTAPTRQSSFLVVRGATSPRFTTAASGRSCSCSRGRAVSIHGWGPAFTRTRPSTARR